MVVMKRNKVYDLYFHQYNTMTGLVGMSSSDNQNSNTTDQLWHIQLGYMNERGMEILSQ